MLKGQQLLLKWSEERVTLARAGVAEAAVQLTELKGAARKRLHHKHASRLRIQVGV